ncbi:MAG: chorismate-binding protein, partial [Mangrovicoccus sp.]|nr:chorismate-binding protein [Mangrovicoccus sp.]
MQPPYGARAGTDDVAFGFYDGLIVFDRLQRHCAVLSSGLPDAGPAATRRARARLAHCLGLLDRPVQARTGAGRIGPWRSNFTAANYATAFERVREHIRDGDIYQANIAQEFRAPLAEDADLFAAYRRLRAVNPAPFGAFLTTGAIAFASSSPERFLCCRSGRAEARPIKGTARRDADPVRDRARTEARMRSRALATRIAQRLTGPAESILGFQILILEELSRAGPAAALDDALKVREAAEALNGLVNRLVAPDGEGLIAEMDEAKLRHD